MIQEGQKLKSKQLQKEMEEKNKGPIIKPSNHNDKFIRKKFEREFNILARELFQSDLMEEQNTERDQEEEEAKNFIRGKMLNYLKFKELLINLGMISDFALANPDNSENTLINDMWNILKGEESEEVTIGNAKIMVMAVMRVKADNRIGVEGGE